MNAIAIIIAVLMIGIGVFSMSAFAREGIAILILFGGVAAWANLSTAGHDGQALAAFLRLFFLSMLVWKPGVFFWPLKEFFLGFFVAKGVKASGVLKPLKEEPVFNERPARDFIYVIRDGGNVKVGIAADPYLRCRQLQTGAVNPLELCFAAPVAGNILAVEQRPHELLAPSRVRINGEWFNCTPQTAIAAIQDAAALVGVSLFR